MSTTDLIIIAALTGYAVFQQTRKHEVTGSGRFKLALIYGIVGIALGVQVGHSAASIGLLIVSLVASLGVGYVRGTRSQLGRETDGRIHSRGTMLTVSLFLALIGFKFVLGTVAYIAHVGYASSMGEVLLMIGLMVGVQAEIIWRRAQALGGRAATTPTTGTDGPVLAAIR